MIVTCESCKSRYKLDDSKITGKGAKITCPKCKNVFVVYARADGAPDPTGMSAKEAPKAPPGRVVAGPAAPKPAPKPEPPPPSTWDDDEPTRVRDTATLAAASRPAAPPPAPPAPPPPAPAPPPEESSTHEVSRPIGRPAKPVEAAPRPPPPPPEDDEGKTDVRASPASAAPEPPRSAAEIAARAAALDFRKVGVTTWKVKVKIGLIYDFSDIKTLRKYIQDGRVTQSDVVSWDGKSWRAIGEIPDLDAFFVETWEMLAATRAEPFDTLSPTAAPKVEAPAAEPEQIFKDPFAERNKKKPKEEPKKPAAAPAPAPASRAPLLLGVLLLLALAGGGWWWWTQQQAVTPPPNPTNTTGTPAPSGEDIRKRLNDDLQKSLQPAPGEAPPETPPSGTPPEKVPVVSDTPPNRTVVPEGATARNPRSNPTSTSAPVRQGDQTAADHEAVGDDAAGSGDWSTAVQAYQKAVSLDPKSGRLVGKLGRAQYEAGDAGGAQGNLKKAASLGWKDAHKYLGHLLAAAGDTAGANAEYQAYLKGNPRDKAEIEAIVAKMNGG